ncbi:MAG: hypothetical protein KBG83_06800, partial [Bacteroidetes bacterium]|nr:hypothetical protein [Bacteroidota bacterium]
TDVYEYSEYERRNLIYSFATMTPEEIEMAEAKLKQYEAEQAAKKSAPPMPPKPSQPSNPSDGSTAS